MGRRKKIDNPDQQVTEQTLRKGVTSWYDIYEAKLPADLRRDMEKLAKEWDAYRKLDYDKMEKLKEIQLKKKEPKYGFQIEGDPAWMYLQSRKGLRGLRTWYCSVDHLGACTPWFVPELFERICNMDKELHKACKSVTSTDDVKGIKKVEDILTKILTQKLLSIIIKKFQQVRRELAQYFIAKANTEACWEEDVLEWETFLQCSGYKSGTVEDETVKYNVNEAPK